MTDADGRAGRIRSGRFVRCFRVVKSRVGFLVAFFGSTALPFYHNAGLYVCTYTRPRSFERIRERPVVLLTSYFLAPPRNLCFSKLIARAAAAMIIFFESSRATMPRWGCRISGIIQQKHLRHHHRHRHRHRHHREWLPAFYPRRLPFFKFDFYTPP